jgi:GxxExxY protein
VAFARTGHRHFPDNHRPAARRPRFRPQARKFLPQRGACGTKEYGNEFCRKEAQEERKNTTTGFAAKQRKRKETTAMETASRERAGREDAARTREVRTLCDQIRGASLALHRHLRHGHFEQVYENGLAHRLRKMGLSVQQQHPMTVLDEDRMVLGEYVADLFVNRTLIVEIKACRSLAPEHVAQILGYLRACRAEHGLLINFGAEKLQIKKFALSVAP